MVYQSTFQRRSLPLEQLAQLIERHWFNAVLLALGLHIFVHKDISIQVNMNGKEAFAARAVGLPVPDRAPAAADRPHNHRKVAKEKQKVAAFSISNLTPVLSPDYGKRHNIPPSVVREKLNVCLDYVDRYSPVARKEMKKYGIPASITLAQGLLESNAGSSRLALESNNHFGIKCRSKCRGCTCRNYSDDDIYDMFRVFESVWDSYREHSLLLTGSRYQHLLDLPKSDYESWAYGLKKAGYATDPNYPQKLIQIIEELELYTYDR